MLDRVMRLALCGVFVALLAHAAVAGTLSTVVFTDYTPLSGNLELARRLLSPLNAARIPELLALRHSALSAQPIDLSQEKFILYVPSQAPPHGYGLVVFVPPWDEARLPDDWAATLDEQGFIFVSAERSGNDTSVLGRREPLALLAEANVAKRYPLDPQRIFIAGFSGGSRVALRLALGYPDVFRGAILNAGSDRIGEGDVPLPPRDLLFRFQSASHLVYLTGELDTFHITTDSASMHSMREWCVFGVDRRDIPDAGHDVAKASAFGRALDALEGAAPPDPDRLAACRASLDSDLAAKLKDVESLAAAGRRGEALEKLTGVDQQFGGLAAPRSTELAAELAR